MNNRSEKSVEEWLMNHEEFSRQFVNEYIQSHPLFLKELVQQEMHKKQQQIFQPAFGNCLSIPESLTPKKPALKHVNSVPNVSGRKSAQQLRMLNKQDLFMELLKDVVSPDFDVNTTSHKILVNVLLLTSADRSSLFLVEGSDEAPILVSRLFDVTENSTLESVIHDESGAIKIPFGTGIVGQVAKTGESIVLEDAYKDSRFSTEVDKVTGYRTKAVMCMPVKTTDGQVIGVAQVINKKGSGVVDHFTEEDQEVFRTYLAFCAIGLINAQLFDQSFALSQQLQTLLHLAKGLFEDATSLEHMMKKIMSEAQELIPCLKAIVLLLERDTGSENDQISFDRAFELDIMNDEFKIIKPSEVQDLEVALSVAKTKRFISTTDASSRAIRIREKASSVLCMPIYDKDHTVIGVVILKDKLNGLPFNKPEKDAFRVFATFCGLGVQNVMNYEEIFKANAKQSVALEVLSYHATASEDEAARLMQSQLPAAEDFALRLFSFDDLPLSDDETVLASVRMFVDLGLVNEFHIDSMCLFRWLLTVKKNYRPVTYHNWRHAFNVAQSMFTMIVSGGMSRKLNELEQLGLLIACFCHDLDHRGTNNAFQAKTDSPLAHLYSTSTMEHHHFDHCIMILTSDGNRILQHLSAKDYKTVIRLLESAILSTDLALYFRKKGQFASLVHDKTFKWDNSIHRDMLRGMLMTACDVSAITKPWPIQQRTAEMVASEFFEQGDRERNVLNIEPIAMMDRQKKDELPKMQVGFIDGICLSLYEVLQELHNGLQPMLEGCRANRTNWQALADNKKENLRIIHTAHSSPAPPTPFTSITTPTNGSIPITVTDNNGSVTAQGQQPIEAWRSNDKLIVERRKKKCTIC